MKLFPLNKALLWKEWRQHHWLLWLAFFIIILVPVLGTLGLLIGEALRPTFFNRTGHPMNWSGIIANMFFAGTNSIFGLWAYVVIGMGIMTVSSDRINRGFEFLITTPVSRREILNSKFFLGAVAIAIMMAVNYLFAVGAAMILPAQYNIQSATEWFLLAGSVLLAIYSLSFFVATITGNVLAAGVGAFGLLVSPTLIHNGLSELIGLTYTYANSSYMQTSSYLQKLFFIPEYLVYDISNVDGSVILINTFTMFLVSIVFYILAVVFFEKNPIELNGHLLLFGKIDILAKFGLPFLIAGMGTSPFFGGHRVNGSIMFIGVYMISFLVISYIFRFYRARGLN